jgi:hypothetical protein
MLSMETWLLLLSVMLGTGTSVGLHLYNGRYLRRTAREQTEQTRLAQLTYRFLVRAWQPQIETRTQQRIVESLLESHYYDSREARDTLAAVCPDRARGTFARNNIPRVDLQAIIRGAADWDSDCLRLVLDEAIDALNGSYSGRKLARIRAEVQAEQYTVGEGDE